MQNSLVEQGRFILKAWVGGLLIGLIILMAGVFYLQKNQCPLSTFHRGQLTFAGGESLLGILGVMVALMVLCLQYLTGITDRIPIFFSVLGFLVAGAACVDSVEYFCATPSNIIIQSGYLDTPISLGWDEVKDVYAWCWIARPRREKPYQGSSLKLTFNNGKDVTFGLVDGGRIQIDDYEMLRGALNNKSYRYRKDSTVNSDLCPPKLYPSLRDWVVAN